MKDLMDEAYTESFMEEFTLFGVPPLINSSGASSIFRNDEPQDWRNGDLTQWFDGAIDVIGSHETAGVLSTRLNDDPPQTYDPWPVIEEPVVVAQGLPYYEEYNKLVDAGEPPLSTINAAELLQIPITSEQAAADAGAWSSKDSPPEFGRNVSYLTDESQQGDTSSAEADSMQLAISDLSGIVKSTSLQGDGARFDEERHQIVATHSEQKMLGSSTFPQSSTEFSMQYAGILQPPFRPGSGRVARKKMTHEWFHRGESTFVIPDDAKMREDRDMMMASESGPPGTAHPLQRVVQPGGSRWAEQLLNLCAGAIDDHNFPRAQHLMWVLNELSSVTGDANERLAAYGLKALSYRITRGKEAEATYLRPFHLQEKMLGPRAVHKALVTFHEFCAWHQIAYTVTNEALMEVFAGKSHLHIVDVGLVKGLQWPALIDALANRPGGPPVKLRITTLRHHNKCGPYTHPDQLDAESVEFLRRLVTFAKVLGFHCELNMYAGPLESFSEADLNREEGETLAVCCQFRLHRISNVAFSHDSWTPQRPPRDAFLELVHSLKPSVFVVSENDVDMLSEDFLVRFKETVSFWWSFFDSIDLSYKGREPVSRAIVEYEGSMIMQNAIAYEGRDRIERNDVQENWVKRIRRAGFVPMSISEDIKKAVQVQLQKSDVPHWSISYSLLGGTNCVSSLWKDQPAVFSSLWKMATCSRKLCKCSMLHD